MSERPTGATQFDVLSFARQRVNRLIRGNRNEHGDRIEDFVEITFPANFDRILDDKVNKEGHVVLGYQNHRSHVDIFSLKKMFDRVRAVCPQIKGVKVPAALSMTTGHQGQDVVESIQNDGLGEWLTRNKVDLVSVVRKLDEERYGLQRGNALVLLSFIQASMDGYAIGEFPEAQTKGGKIAQDGRPFGLQPFDDGGLMYGFTRRHLKSGRKVLFIPAASVGSENVFDPDKKKTQDSAKVKYVANRIVKAVGGHAPIKLIHTTVGLPFSSDYITESIGRDGQLTNSQSFYGFMEMQLQKVDSHDVGFEDIGFDIGDLASAVLGIRQRERMVTIRLSENPLFVDRPKEVS